MPLAHKRSPLQLLVQNVCINVEADVFRVAEMTCGHAYELHCRQSLLSNVLETDLCMKSDELKIVQVVPAFCNPSTTMQSLSVCVSSMEINEYQ